MTTDELSRLDYILDQSRPCLARVCEVIGIDAERAPSLVPGRLPDDDRIDAITFYVATGHKSRDEARIAKALADCRLTDAEIAALFSIATNGVGDDYHNRPDSCAEIAARIVATLKKK